MLGGIGQYKTPAVMRQLVRTISVSEKLSSNAPNHFDIAIAGGGLIGTTLACTLGNLHSAEIKNVPN